MSATFDQVVVQQKSQTIPSVSAVWEDWLDAAHLKRLTRHPLLVAISEGEVDLDGLRFFLVQHHLYSRNFTRYLSALISRLPNLQDIRELNENLLEELGIDDEGKITHAEMLQRSLQAIGADPQHYAALPETQVLVRTMLDYCRSPDPLDGLSALCLGAEAIVPLFYHPIMQALVRYGFNEEATDFFRLHVEEDENHALTMLSILRRITAQNPALRSRAQAIGADAIERRCDMFDAVWKTIQRKSREVQDAQYVGERASSADFWRVPSQLRAQIPERLHHPSVMSNQDAGASSFSNERKHKVHIVDLPTNSISMTIGRLRPRESTRLHRHNYETVIYVVAGKGFSRIGSRVVDWSAGDAVYVPVWAPHQHVSTDVDECVYIACENAPLLQNLGAIALREELGAIPN